MTNPFKHLFLSKNLYWLLAGLISLFVLGYFFPPLFPPAKGLALGLLILLCLDALILFGYPGEVQMRRDTPDRFSNGDENPVQVHLLNQLRWPIKLIFIDDIPDQFQIRNFSHQISLKAGESHILAYKLRPVTRGTYQFENLHTYVTGPIGLLQRRFITQQKQVVKVYPSFIQMRRYELLAISNRLSEAGIKKIRRIGHTMEFDQIREYVQGDDYRTINWKATARRRDLMVNHYQDERSQQVFSAINMGRVMKMPFNGLTLLDYAINASLVISNIALLKQDKAGLITFSNQLDTVLPAQRRSGQMAKILESLYHQQTDFKESDYQRLLSALNLQVKRRSLVLLFTNFESMNSLKRQIKYLKAISARHLLVVIFFENTELNNLAVKQAHSVHQIYLKTIANQFQYEKNQIVKELQQQGIHSILTAPENLTVNTINKYLYLKARGLA